MANYIYQTIIYRNTTNVFNPPDWNASALTDFETNHIDDVLNISALLISETSFEIDKTYPQFDTLIAEPYTWSDVKVITEDKTYKLYLLTSSPL